MTPLLHLPCLWWLELQLLVELGHLKNLIQESFSEYATIDKILSREDSITYRLLQLFLELGFFFLKALDLLFHLIKFSCVLTVSFIKLVPCSKSFIKTLGNLYILLCQGVPIVYSLIQSLRLQERSIGNILWHTRQDWSDVNNYSRKTNSSRILTLVYLKLHCI